MPPPKAVSNASPIIALARIGQLSLMQQVLGSVLLPTAVESELGSGINVPSWCTVQSLSQALPATLAGAGLDLGETEAIALAIESGLNFVILDDGPARLFARSMGLNLTGTIGIVLDAKQSGFVLSVKPIIDALIQTGFFVSSQLYVSALQSVGESP